MENEENELKLDTFKSNFERQDISKLPSFKKWKDYKKKEGKEVVKCPKCWGYEVLVEPTNHKCENCGQIYCQKCLKICVDGEIQHNHERNYCSKFCTLFEYLFSESCHDCCINCCDCNICRNTKRNFKITLLFLFGSPGMFTIKYYQFFKNNKIRESNCVHWFFTYLNLITNIIYSIIFNILSIELFSVILFPSIFCLPYYEIIMYNWEYVYERLDVGQCPITELTVKGRGYNFLLI